ncbi:hypothetical protein HS961_09310 [Comamonas piscis]|uniref:Uncharacterized protein n=1 Tax=Comamonas piscis TaxID=1562974 RepID=A0A7G5EG97_9BURK|nr:hypothetical protein [Comamonas piscis]QMV73022.1 hypothetical protein HS961_09310 [Comamonas piscis]WSO35807.1 hypothetical protein VUJ63_09340 [Comamonas piscis]
MRELYIGHLLKVLIELVNFFTACEWRAYAHNDYARELASLAACEPRAFKVGVAADSHQQKFS